MQKLAIVLFNLGGPDQLSSVKPFLFNLFNDKAIISAPMPIRWLLAHYISSKRAPIAQEIYAQIGGKSPLLELTQQQAQALESEIAERDSFKDFEVKCFISMRYWHPMSDETVEAVKNWAPDQVILLPLYPQFSKTTSGSSIEDWLKTSDKHGLKATTTSLCCYPTEPGFVNGVADLIRPKFEEAYGVGRPRILFSAHGLPKKIIEQGDPYQWQVEWSAKAVVDALAIENLDWVVCYQSRVGPLEWIGPSTEAELERAAQDKVPVVVVPIAFVSEHSETLVELDIEYREMAHELGIPGYFRVPAVGTNGLFIKGLADLIADHLDIDGKPSCFGGMKVCGGLSEKCLCRQNENLKAAKG